MLSNFESDLVVSDSTFAITMRHLGPMQPLLDLFIVVNDGGYPFLLGCVRTSWGMEVHYNNYINPLLEADIRQINEVNVVEIDVAGQRSYSVPLRHSFE